MNRRNFLSLKYFAISVFIFGLVALGFFSNEARKEIYFLCGNYAKGDSLESVVRQLNTVKLSEYKIESTEQGKLILHSSKLNLHLVNCNIEFNPEEKIVSVSYGQT